MYGHKILFMLEQDMLSKVSSDLKDKMENLFLENEIKIRTVLAPEWQTRSCTNQFQEKTEA